MGSKKSSSKVISNSNTNLDALARQNEQSLAFMREQAAQQNALFQQQTQAMKDMNAEILKGQKETLSAQALGARNQEIANRAAGQNAYADSLEQQSLNMRNQRLQEKQNNMAMNQANRADAVSENQRLGLISDFIRRRRQMTA